MPIDLETTVGIPPAADAVAFSTNADVLYRDDGWLQLQRTAADALIRSQVASGTDIAALFCVREGIDAAGLRATLVTMMFVTEGDTHDIAAIGAGLEGSGVGWTDDGIQEIPDRAFPSLAYVDGQLHQVWLSSPGGIVALSIGWREEGPIAVPVKLEDADLSMFLPTVTHAKVVPGDRKKQVHSHADRLKAAFAMAVSQRIMDSDGKRPEPEVEFFERTFSRRLLRSMDLEDQTTLHALQTEADAELCDHIDLEQKLGLIGLFYRVCQADGFVDDRELIELRAAATRLGLTSEQVTEYLENVD